MKIEEILKTNTSLSASKRTVINLLFIGSQVNSRLNEVLKPFEVSIQQFNVLRILRGQKQKPVTLSTIQERMITKMSNTTRLIDKLVLKELVNKSINKNNKRKIDIVITNKGLQLLKKLDVIIENTEIGIVSSLNKKETTELNRLLGKIRLIAN